VRFILRKNVEYILKPVIASHFALYNNEQHLQIMLPTSRTHIVVLQEANKYTFGFGKVIYLLIILSF
jgi:hypothetical protein